MAYGMNVLKRIPVAAAIPVVVVALAAVLVTLRPSAAARWSPAGGPGSSTSDTALGGPPTRVRIAKLKVDAPLVDLRLDSKGALQAPEDYNRPGWYVDGPLPGEIGPAVIAGHVDSKSGPAVFFKLHELHSGDIVEVERGRLWVKFRVVAVHRYPKNAFPTNEVYGPTPNPQLRLITCGGVFDNTRRSYVDNVVVFAVIVT